MFDPLYKWTISPVRALQLQQEPESQRREGTTVSVTAGAGAHFTELTSHATAGEGSAHSQEAERVIVRVQQKLQGYEEGSTSALGVEGQVNLLIQQARDPERLAALYFGWGAWI